MYSGTANLPDFFLLGAAKAGTTSLYEYLVQHPDICSSTVKEPHFFDDDADYSKGYEWYLRRYYANCRTANRLGDATPMLHLPEIVAPRIKDVYGPIADRIKFVVILRDPVERAWSHYLHRVRLGVEPLGFEEALTLEDERIEKSPQAWVGYYRDGLYYQQLEKWYRVFSSCQMQVLLHDDLKSNPRVVIQSVCQFIDVGLDWEFDTTRMENQAGYTISPRLMRMINVPSPAYVQRYTNALLPKDVRQRIRSIFRNFLTRPYKSKPQLDPAVADVLRRRYEPSIGRLESMIDRDLSSWQQPSL